jgi:hypothetical protein
VLWLVREVCSSLLGGSAAWLQALILRRVSLSLCESRHHGEEAGLMRLRMMTGSGCEVICRSAAFGLRSASGDTRVCRWCLGGAGGSAGVLDGGDDSCHMAGCSAIVSQRSYVLLGQHTGGCA